MRVSVKWLLSVLILVVSSCSMEKLYQMNQKKKVSPYEQIDFGSMVKRYMDKDQSSIGTIEGIYSVSSLITKKGKGLLSPTEKEKVVDRRENYSKVAIIRDTENPKREYLEVPLDKDFLPSYSIRGEFTGVSDGNIMVYKHFEPRGKVLSYTFAYDHKRDILEGIRTENDGAFTITYQLTYLKLFPKVNDESK
jgi:hypothetical protein